MDLESDDARKQYGNDKREGFEVVGLEKRDGVSADVDVGCLKKVVEAGTSHADTVLGADSIMDKGDNVDQEVGIVAGVEIRTACDVEDVKTDGQELTIKRRRGRPRKLLDKRNSASSEVGTNVLADDNFMDKGAYVNQEVVFSAAAEMGTAGEAKDVKIGAQELTIKRKRGRPRKLIDKCNAISLETGTNVIIETGSDVDKQKLAVRRKRGRTQCSLVEHTEHASYHCPFQDESKVHFTVYDLVWAKVRRHPWWPGQILSSSDSSGSALNNQKKHHHLVAYFGDKTFYWCDESQLKQFQTYFSLLGKQRSLDSFVIAMYDATREVSRRVELGLTCQCFMDESYGSLKEQKVENTGIREETCCYTVNKSFVINSFEPLRFVDYIKTLAQFPFVGVDRLELAIAKSQLKSFYRSKGYTELPVFVIDGLEDGVVGPPSKSGDCGDNADPSTLHPSHAKYRIADFDFADLGKGEKKMLDSLGDSITSFQTSRHEKRSKVGENISRVAGQMTGSPSMIKVNCESLPENPTKVSHIQGAVGHALQTKIPGAIENVSIEFFSSSDMLARLLLAAIDPMAGYSFLPTIVSFFTDFRSQAFSVSSEDEKATDSQKKPTSVKLRSLRMMSAGARDTYWPDIIVNKEEELISGGEKAKGESQQPVDESSLALPVGSMPDDGLHGVEIPNDMLEMDGEKPNGELFLLKSPRIY